VKAGRALTVCAGGVPALSDAAPKAIGTMLGTIAAIQGGAPSREEMIQWTSLMAREQWRYIDIINGAPL
jgi:hypothetical protein